MLVFFRASTRELMVVTKAIVAFLWVVLLLPLVLLLYHEEIIYFSTNTNALKDLLMLESVRTKTTTSQGYKSPRFYRGGTPPLYFLEIF
jgi:hypothetical protein